MWRRLIVWSAAIALVFAAMPSMAAGAASSGWKIYSYNPSGRALSSKQATADDGAIAQFEFLSTPDDALLATERPGGPHATLNGRTISATFLIESTPGATFHYFGEVSCGNPFSSVRLYFSTNGKFAFTNFWWSNPASFVLTAPGAGTATAKVEPANWSDWNGKFGTEDPATTAAFEAAAADPYLVGLSFGGGCFFENGVGVSDGTATFKLTSFSISP